jgi:competence protein ComGC
MRAGKTMKKSKGMTLIEILVYITILIFVTGTIFSIYHDSARIARAGNNYLHNLRSTELVISTIQRDIREANRIVSLKGDFVTGKGTLILRNEIKESYIIYHFDEAARKLERVVIAEEGTHYNRVIGANLQEVKFGYDREPPSDSRLINVKLILKEGALKKDRTTSFPFSVALRRR